MRKQWILICAMSLFLTACESTKPSTPTLPPLTQSGPVKEINGAEPRYEPYDAGTLKDYKVKGKTYHIVTEPEKFSQIGLAVWYGHELHGNKTSTGEIFDANELTAAHPTLPLPSYVRVTNLNNGRQLIVRVNDRGPFTAGKIIDLSKAAAERLNIASQTKVRVDAIVVAPNGALSGPGTVGTIVAKQSYALEDRPMIGSSSAATEKSAPTGANPFAAKPLTAQQSELVSIPAQPDNNVKLPTPASNNHSLLSGTPQAAQPSSGYMVQVSAVNDRQNADAIQKKLSNQLNVPGKVSNAGAIYRVQLGPFNTKQQAQELQQRLAAQGQSSFIMVPSL
ncbi:MAG: endolytic peptidoglycan transglycosylase RlpA [Enterobacteriaceae bacterium]|nr:endolytic peptidoglycan transglycosylase RlpA [Enterobacteriaceae bacterium]